MAICDIENGAHNIKREAQQIKGALANLEMDWEEIMAALPESDKEILINQITGAITQIAISVDRISS
jgi:hypothetical protein